MAMGAAVFMGITFPLNFNKPYLTCTLTDFWRSWHMSLSRWFKDYVYIPLGGSKKNKITTYRNLLITMSLAGLWHGASLNFVIWGFLNGIILIFEKIINYSNNFKFPKIFLNCFIIFNLWLIFRITDFDLYFIFIIKLYTQLFETLSLTNLLIFLFSLVLIYSQKFDNFFILKKLSNKISFYSLIIFFIFIVSTGLALNLGQSEKFIYFQF
jgi:alginate O-acetyltransferase complex protein AlgI